MTYAEKLKDPRWQKKRLEILHRDNFTCQWCSCTTKTLHVHHFCYIKGGNPWDSQGEDLVTICCDCHTVQHAKLTRLEDLLIEEIKVLNYIHGRQDRNQHVVELVIEHLK